MHLQDSNVPHRIISVKNNSQISGKMLDFRYHLSTKYGVRCCKERHPLLLKCFITFFGCIRMAVQASGSIYKPIMFHRVLFMPKTALQFDTKYQIMGTLPAQEIACCTARRYIYCCWSVFITFFICIEMIGLASDSIYVTIMVHTISFLPNTPLKFQAKCQILSTI